MFYLQIHEESLRKYVWKNFFCEKSKYDLISSSMVQFCKIYFPKVLWTRYLVILREETLVYEITGVKAKWSTLHPLSIRRNLGTVGFHVVFQKISFSTWARTLSSVRNFKWSFDIFQEKQSSYESARYFHDLMRFK